MEYYFYVILIFAIVLKLTVYLCWYQVRRSASTREVRIIMPDGSTRCAVVTGQGRLRQSSRQTNVSEERQNLPQADMLAPYDNQGMVETPVQPHYGDSSGQLGVPPPYVTQDWKLPKYEEAAGMPPPYTAAAAAASVAEPTMSGFVPVLPPPAPAPSTQATDARSPAQTQPLPQPQPQPSQAPEPVIGGTGPTAIPPSIPCQSGQM